MVEWYTDGETLTVLTTTVALPYTSKDSVWPNPVTKPCSRGLHPHGRAQYLRVGSSRLSLELNAPIPLGDFQFAPWLVRDWLRAFSCFCLESFFLFQSEQG